MTLHGQILAIFESYLVNSKKFEEKGTKAAAIRARKDLSELRHLIRERRKEIQEAKRFL